MLAKPPKGFFTIPSTAGPRSSPSYGWPPASRCTTRYSTPTAGPVAP